MAYQMSKGLILIALYLNAQHLSKNYFKNFIASSIKLKSDEP